MNVARFQDRSVSCQVSCDPYVPLSIRFDGPTESMSRWVRWGDLERDHFEIGFDQEDGRLRAIKLLAVSALAPPPSVTKARSTCHGCPYIDCAQFPARITTIEAPVLVSLDASGTLGISWPGVVADTYRQVSDGVLVAIDENGVLAGILIDANVVGVHDCISEVLGTSSARTTE